MTEHVCEWELKAYLYVGVPIFGCKIKGCHEKLDVRQAEARLNATERLSAGCFNCKKTIQETYLRQFPSGDYTCRDCDIAFADTLEGTP